MPAAGTGRGEPRHGWMSSGLRLMSECRGRDPSDGRRYPPGASRGRSTMTHPEPRDREQRTRDTLAKLAEPAADVWVATAAAAGPSADPYLVPLSLAWIDGPAV